MIEPRRPVLSHVRVLDLTGPIGQYCGKLLADLGADVVKVEPPGGDQARFMAPFAGDKIDPELSLFFVSFNTNKRSIVLDLEHPRDRTVFRKLVRVADIVLESFAPGTLDRLNLGYNALKSINPAVILTSITPFGQTGPYHNFKANDMIGVAMGGMMYINGEPHLPPCTSPLYQAYQMAGTHAAFGTIMALIERNRSGIGQRIDVSMQEVVAHMFFTVVSYSATSDILIRQGARGNIVPNGIYPTRDGYVSLSIFYPHHWRLLVEWMADPILQHPGWEEREVRRENGDLIDTRITEFTKQFSTHEFVAEAQRRHIPAGPVNSIADFVAMPHVVHRGLFVELDHPRLGRYRYPGPSFRMSESPQHVYRPAPLLGQHTREVLAQWLRLGGGYRRPPRRSLRRRSAPLNGVRVIDFTRVWAGPFGTRFLADYGADVIRVESTKFPDTRGAPYLPPRVRHERDAHFAEMHRNKRSITLDLHTDDGQKLVRQLIMTADLMVENFGPGLMERFRLDYERVRVIKPDIIYLSMPGLGREGPDSHMLAYGQQLMGYLGLGPLWRHPESPLSASTKLAYPDFIAAGQLALAVVAALLERERTGRGQFVEIAQIDATVAMMGVAFLDYFVNGRIWQARGNIDQNYAPHGAYRCVGHDRWVAIGCADDAEWEALCNVMDAPHLLTDPRFGTKTLRHMHRAELDHLIEEWTSTQTPHQVMYRLQQAGVPAGVVASSEDLYHDLQLRARGYLVTVNHPDTGPLEHPGMTVRLSATPGSIYRPAPRLGEHNDDIFLGLLQIPAAEYRLLAEKGVIA